MPICFVRTAGLHPHIPKKYAAVQTLVLPRIWDIFERELKFSFLFWLRLASGAFYCAVKIYSFGFFVGSRLQLELNISYYNLMGSIYKIEPAQKHIPHFTPANTDKKSARLQYSSFQQAIPL